MTDESYETPYIDYPQYLDFEDDSEVLEIVGRKVEPAPIIRKKKTTAKVVFSTTEKKKLAAIIEENPAIWRLDSKHHRNAHAVAAQWEAVATHMGKSVEDCKLGWKSIRDGMRYRKNLKAKSGSAADLDEVSHGETVDENWELSASLGFLSSLSSQRKRRTFSGASTSTIASTSQMESIDSSATPSDELNLSNYSYSANQRKRRKIADEDEEIETLSTYLKDMIERREAKESGQVQVPDLKYISVWTNLDKICQMLPEVDVHLFAAKFSIELLEEVKKNKEKET